MFSVFSNHNSYILSSVLSSENVISLSLLGRTLTHAPIKEFNSDMIVLKLLSFLDKTILDFENFNCSDSRAPQESAFSSELKWLGSFLIRCLVLRTFRDPPRFLFSGHPKFRLFLSRDSLRALLFISTTGRWLVEFVRCKEDYVIPYTQSYYRDFRPCQKVVTEIRYPTPINP